MRPCWCEVQQDAVRPRGRSSTCYSVSELNSKSNKTELDMRSCSAAELFWSAGSHEIKQANDAMMLKASSAHNMNLNG